MHSHKAIVLGVLALAAVIIGFYPSPTGAQSDQFAKFKKDFGFEFAAAEDTYRRFVFNNNLKLIEQHNSQSINTYTLGINQFAALTKDEFVKGHLMEVDQAATKSVNSEETQLTGPTIDWEVQGKVTAVRSQGSCVAGYAFSAAGAVESMSAIYYRAPTQLSPQYIVDCSSTYGNTGCTRGRMDNSFNFITAKGINTEDEYPWKGSQGQCRSTAGSFRKVNGYRNVTDCTSLANVLANQPVSVMIDGANLQLYRGGVFSNCGTNLNVGLLLIGMNDEAWRLKNSFGSTWGEQGYIRITRGNTCGVCLQGSYPVPA